MFRKFQFKFLLILLGLLFAATQSGYAQSVNGPLNFGNNYFVTGDYIVSGAKGMNTNFSNGYAVGTFTIPDANPGIHGTTSVPQGAEVVAALLYWQTVENVGTVPGQPGTGENGFFRPVIKNGGPAAPGYPISGISLPGHNAVSWSSGGCSEPSSGKLTRTYRANVIGALPRDPTGNIAANGTYEIRLPSVGPETPLTLGATLVIIYRILSPNVPLRSIVIYDGAFGQDDVTLNMTQTVQGFYDADGAVSKLTLIAGAGKSNKSQTVYLNNVALPSHAGRNMPPFPGYYGTWDNPTWTFGDPEYPEIGNLVPSAASFAKTEVVPSANGPGCLSWGVVIVSTTVQNTDNDGLLDSWKSSQGYCDASVNEGKCNPATDPSWVALPGAMHGEKDVFIQLDYMCSQLLTGDSCTTGDGTNYSFDPRPSGAIGLLTNATDTTGPFAAKGIHLHINPSGGIHAIQETTCQDIPASGNTPAQLCSFPGQPGVVAWKGGFDFIKNQLVDSSDMTSDCTGASPAASCMPRFQPGKRSSWHYILSAHAVGQPKWKLQDDTLASVKQSGHIVTFTTTGAVGTLDNIDNVQGGPIIQDPSCANGRVTIFGAGTNANLNGTFCVNTSTAPNGDTFTIVVPGPSENTSYTYLTDPNLAVAPSFTSTASGVSDVGGEDSLVTLGLWGNPALNGHTPPPTAPAADGQSEPVLAGTFMHEFGHALGLTHGGFTYQTQNSYVPTLGPNCKPNFQSVMNYQFQVDLLAPLGGGSTVPDYSGVGLASLDKASGGGPNVFTSPLPLYLNTVWFGKYNGVGAPIIRHCDGSPNTNNGQASPSSGVASSLFWIAGQDLNFDGNTNETLQGYNDWANVDLRQIGATGTNSTAEAGGQNFGGGGQNFGGGGQNLGGGGQNLGGGGQNFGGGGQNLGGGGQNFGGGGQNFGGGGEIDIATVNAYTRPPQTLMASENGSARTITLNWTAPTFGQIGSYKVYRAVIGGAPSVIATVSGNPPALTYTDTTDTCTVGYEYFVTAVLSNTSANPGQESTGSNTVTVGTNGGGILTGCYTVTGFSSPASATQGSIISVTWTLQDDFNTTGAPVNNLAANTLVAIGPGGARTTLVSKGLVTAPGASAFGVSSGTFTFNWDSDPFPSGSYTFELDLDSGQVKTTSPPLVLGIDVNDNDSPQITTVSLPNGVVGKAYGYALSEEGGTGPFTWSLVAHTGAPPSGIMLSAGGTLTGTSCIAGPATFTVKVTDSAAPQNSGTRPLSLTISQASTTTGVISSVTPSVFGQTVIFTATVAPQYTSNCTPTGTVNFFDGVTNIGSGQLVAATGTATFMTSGLAVASHSITAVYVGDTNFTTSTSSAILQTVNKADTNTSITSAPANPSIYGQVVSFMATVSAVAPGAGTPTGTVTFEDGGTALAGNSTVQLSGATASFSTTADQLMAGPHMITAVYNGDSDFNLTGFDLASTATPFSQTIHKADTTTSLAVSPGSSNLGDVVTVTAAVTDTTTSSSGTPTGLVTFFSNGTPIGTGTLAVGNSGNQATFTTSLLAVGSDSITAAYDGDSNFYATGADNGSTLSAAATETVALRGTNVSVLLNPSTQSVNSPSAITVTVTDGGTTNPAGTADSWVATSAAPATGTTGSTATLFADGVVLVAGGTNSGGTVVANAYIYSATTNTFTAAAGNLKTARTGASATLLPNGEILIAGGSSDGTATNALQTAELYNPITGTFTLAGSGSSNAMTAVRFGATATLLTNGQVLIAGGQQTSGSSQATAELYNPATDSFTATGSLGTARYDAAAVLLGNGSVLIAGGTGAAGPLNSAELYTSGSFAPAGTGTMTASRTGATATLLLSGNVLIAGGSSDGATALNSAELYNAGSATFTASNSTLNTARFNGSATLLPNGMALLVGGATSQVTELYDPDSDRFDPTGSLNNADQASLTATLLNKDNVLITGLTSGGSPVADAELYAPTFDPLGTVALTSSDNSDVFSGPCILTISGSGASTCATAPTVTPGEIGATNPHTITGTYPADSVHSTSTMGAPLTVQ